MRENFLSTVLAFFVVLFATIAGSTNLILAQTFTPITPVSATAEVNNADAAKTIDNNSNECNSPTYWQAAAENACIKYDLGEVKTVVGFQESAGPFPGNPFTAFISTDDVNYVQVASGTLTSLWPSGQCAFGQHFFTSTPVRFLKICVQRTDDAGFGELVDFRALVPAAPPNQPPAVTTDNASVTVNEGQIANNTGTVNDPDGDAVTLSTSVGTVTDNGNGTWSWGFTTNDGPVQSQTVTIAADDGNGGAAQSSFSLTVNNVAPSVDAITVPIDPIDIANQPVSVSATFSDPAGTNDEPYTCTIDFGDGIGPQAGTVSGMTCSVSHTYASAGNYVVTVYVTDKDGGNGSAVAEQSIVITENQPPIVGANQATVVADEGQTATNTGTVNDPDGDAVTLIVSVGTVINNGNGTWSWSFTTSDGPTESQTVTIIADDGNGGMAQTSFSLTVNNVALSVDAITVPIDPIDIASQPVSISATFSDPAGTNDEPYTCAIDFGDGSGQQAGTVDGMTCSASHTYSAAGVYIVTVTVTDKDYDSGSASATNFIVIYDPSAGYVTGGGWIDSPPGAYVSDPMLAGKANFGFVSKYQKGNSIPDGNTTFHFNTASFKFKSTSYEWLVIAGAKAQYKGEGVVNNSGNYGFMLFATDGQINGGGGVDKFRIKIWDKNNGDAVVYDNQMGDPDDGDATDPIEGGSITIHGGSAGKAATSEEMTSAPQDYALAQNYPNPFNPSTTFAFDLPKATEVKLTIYSITGQVVATVFSGQLNAGHYTYVWEAPANIVSGVYFYKLETAEFTSVKKMIFQK